MAVVTVYSSSTQEVEAVRLGDQGHLQLHSELEASMTHIKLSQKKKKTFCLSCLLHLLDINILSAKWTVSWQWPNSKQPDKGKEHDQALSKKNLDSPKRVRKLGCLL